MRIIKLLFTPRCDKYDGIRPINIYAMRAIYGLMFFLMGSDAWRYILTYEGIWEVDSAMNWSVWGAFSLLAFIGLFRTVEMIPVMLLEILYKSIWLILVALPLYQSGNLSDQATDGMLFPFLLVILPIFAVPWGYVVRKYMLFKWFNQ